MSIICPNLKNEEVAREFEELKNATSEAAAYHIWSLNNGNGIDKAPNGEPSKLFSDLLEHYNGDRVAAIQAKARTYSNSFRDWFGDWTNTIKPGNIIFGHPAIGKTYSLESGKYKDKLIDWDEEFNTKRDKWIEDHSNTVKGTPEYKKARNEYLIYPERHPDYVEFIKSEWERVKNKVKKEGKILFASPHNLLKMFPQDFNRIINLKDDDFIKRNIGRGGKEKESKLWKEGINETISNTTGIPVEYLNENQYFEDYLNKHLGISKVVDENGEPKLMFHGSDNVFDTFRNDVAIYTTDAMSTADSYFYSESNVNDRMELFEYNSEFENYGLEREGDYARMEYLLNEYSSLEKPSSEYDNPYSNSPFFNNKFAYKPYKTADDFLHNVFPDFLNHIDNAEYRKEIINAYVEHEHPINPNDFYKRSISGQILPLFVSNKNPLVIDGKGSSWNEIEYNGKIWSTRDLEIFAKNNNYDGLIINNIIDLGGRQSMASMDYGSATVAVSYNPNQVKSIDNQGTFSTQDNNIYNQIEPLMYKIIDFQSDLHKNNTIKYNPNREYNSDNYTNNQVITKVISNSKDLLDNSRSKMATVLRDVANKINMQPVSIEYTDRPLNEIYPEATYWTPAIYDKNTNKIVVNTTGDFSRYGSLENVLLHEIAHAITLDSLAADTEAANELRAIQKEYAATHEDHASKNVYEFAAELFSNPEVIHNMQDFPAPTGKKTILQRLMDWFKRLFGKNTTHENLINRIVENVIEYNAYQTLEHNENTDDYIPLALPAASKREEIAATKLMSTFDSIVKTLEIRTQSMQYNPIDDSFDKRETVRNTSVFNRLYNLSNTVKNITDPNSMLDVLNGSIEYMNSVIDSLAEAEKVLDNINEKIENAKTMGDEAATNKYRVALDNFGAEYLYPHEANLNNLYETVFSQEFNDAIYESLLGTNVFNDIRQTLNALRAEFSSIKMDSRNNIGWKYKNTVIRTLTNFLKGEMEEANDPRIESALMNWLSFNSDISAYHKYVGLPNSTNNTVISSVRKVIGDVNNEVHKKVYHKYAELMGLAAATRDHLLLFERNSKGKKQVISLEIESMVNIK